MGNKSSSHVPPTHRDSRPVYFNNIPLPPPGHPSYLDIPPPPGSFVSNPYGSPSIHQSVSSLHHPSGTDSGYMTSPSDTERWKANVCLF
uniref:Protein EARLY FLOWERING 3-like n=1 Tax=Syphacia muris TaxID=451379 RepID=A0A0N5ALM0_9BILA